MLPIQIFSRLLFIAQAVYALEQSNYSSPKSRWVPTESKPLKLSPRDAPTLAAPMPGKTGLPAVNGTADLSDWPPAEWSKNTAGASKLLDYFPTSDENCTATVQWHHLVTSIQQGVKWGDAYNKSVNGKDWGAEALGKFRPDYVYSRLTVFVGRTENWTLEDPYVDSSKFNLDQQKSGAPLRGVWADGKNHTFGIMMTFNCNGTNSTDKKGGFFLGVSGRQIIAMFHMLSDDRNLNLCGGAHFDNGCWVSIDFCLDLDCVDTPGEPAPPPYDQLSAGEENSGATDGFVEPSMYDGEEAGASPTSVPPDDYASPNADSAGNVNDYSDEYASKAGDTEASPDYNTATDGAGDSSYGDSSYGDSSYGDSYSDGQAGAGDVGDGSYGDTYSEGQAGAGDAGTDAGTSDGDTSYGNGDTYSPDSGYGTDNGGTKNDPTATDGTGGMDGTATDGSGAALASDSGVPADYVPAGQSQAAGSESTPPADPAYTRKQRRFWPFEPRV